MSEHRIQRALALLEEYEKHCKDQGLPSDTPVHRFVQHHRGNAALAATFQNFSECGRGCKLLTVTPT
jgi:hypothetical protein